MYVSFRVRAVVCFSTATKVLESLSERPGYSLCLLQLLTLPSLANEMPLKQAAAIAFKRMVSGNEQSIGHAFVRPLVPRSRRYGPLTLFFVLFFSSLSTSNQGSTKLGLQCDSSRRERFARPFDR
jgi:hypothetical protein